MDETIKIPIIIEAKEFSDKNLGVALKACHDAGYRALYMPEILDIRMNCDKDHPIWSRPYTTKSVRVTGTTRRGNKIVIYAHVPNYFSDPKAIENAVSREFQHGAYSYPQKEFDKLLAMEDEKNVFVVDYNILSNSLSGKLLTYNALKHPQVIPFLGGKERAEKYLEYHEKVIGKEMSIWHLNDMHGSRAYGRLLCLGSWATGGALNGGRNMRESDNCGHFIGIPSEKTKIIRNKSSPLESIAGTAIQLPGSKILLIDGEELTDKQYDLLIKKVGPTMDDLLEFSKGFMAENGGIIKQNWKDFEKGLKDKYEG